MAGSNVIKEMSERVKQGLDRVTCPICGHQIKRHQLRMHMTAEKWVLDKIQQHHPEWEESDGICTRCWEYYRNLVPQHPS